MQANSVHHQPITPGSETIMPLDNAQLTIEDFVDQLGDTFKNGEAKVIVSCNYCSSFRSVLNSQTWENIMTHIQPVAREELHTTFYGNILRNFSRSLKIQVLGRTKEFCEVIVTHGLVCRKTGAWFQIEKPSIQVAMNLATHIAAIQPKVSGSCGSWPRGNSVICLFCSSPFTVEEYQEHLSSHQEQINPCLLLIAGAYCSNTFKTEIKKLIECETCKEGEHQDFRFLPCHKFIKEYRCTKKLQATIQILRENFAYGGFLQVTTTALTKCCVCQNQSPSYCVLFKITNPILQENGQNDMLAVCSNCQKEFVNIIMRENGFDNQLIMFKLHHMEQICGVLRVLLSVCQKVCNGQHNILYTVQEEGSLFSPDKTLHKVLPAKLIDLGNNKPAIGQVILEEKNNIDMSGPSIRFVCDQCKLSVDLTRFEHKQAKSDTHLVEMILAVVLEHTVPHTDSLVSVITTAANNEMFDLKFEFNAVVEGEGDNRRISVSLDRKIIPTRGTAEISIQKDVYKTIESIKSKLTPDKRGNIKLMNRYVYLDHVQPEILPGQPTTVGTTINMNRFLERAKTTLSIYGSTGCNTNLLEYYSNCKLCEKFSYPDFRLMAGMQPRTTDASTTTENVFKTNVRSVTTAVTGSATNFLCENCFETILSLCGSSEPERLVGCGEHCFLLDVDRNSGHRLVLSNQAKKWISTEGVEAIKSISDVAALSTISDYSSMLIQKLQSYLKAVCSRIWSDPDCANARAGFIVKPPVPGQNPPIEVKVTLRPPKPKTPVLVGLGQFGGVRLGVPEPVGREQGGKASTISQKSSTGSSATRGSSSIRGLNGKMNPYNKWLESCKFPSYAAMYDWMEFIAQFKMGMRELPFPLSALEQPGIIPCPEILSFLDRCMKAANCDNSEAKVIELIKYLKDNPPKVSFENPKFKEKYTKDEKDLMQHILHEGLELPGSRHNLFGHLQSFSSFFIDMFFGNYTEFIDHVNSLTKADLQKELNRREGYCQLSPLFASIIGFKLVDMEKKLHFTSKEVKEFRSMYSGCNENKHVEITHKLVQLGADVKAHDIFGFTPLHYAVLSRNEGMVTVLLKNGANPNAESGDGFRPLTSLICAGHVVTLRLIDILLQYNAKVIDKKDIEEIRNKVQINGSRELAVRVREAHPREKNRCEKCTGPAEKKCAACNLVFYCTPACQKGDWKFHKVTCKKVRAK